MPRDTTSEAFALQFAQIRAMTLADRLAQGVALCDFAVRTTVHALRLRFPDLSEHEIAARWTEQMYRGQVPDALLDRACAEIRKRGEAGQR